ncbi:MAG: hypothetical protein AAFR16_06240, partial [Pseudomonadota bacterium]
MNQPLPNSIAALAPELAEWRHDIHRHPELGYEETRTAAVVAERLRGFGIEEIATGIGGTGVVATPEQIAEVHADLRAELGKLMEGADQV